MFKKLLTLLLPLLCTSVLAAVPELTRFYPDSREKIQEYKPYNGKIYAYFATGSKIVSAKGQLTQNGELLGEVVFAGNAAPTAYATMKAADNPAMEKIQVGEFSISLYEVTYIDAEETKTYSDISKPLGTTTYYVLGEGGTIVSETGLTERLLVSYYDLKGDDGVKTFTFSKPVDPSKINVALEYGTGDFPYITPVPWTLSDDGLTLTVDFRGLSLNTDALAYGHIFYDLDGNPTAPPTTIVLIVNNLNCTDGTRIAYESISLDGQSVYTVRGQIYLSLNYKDLSHPNPVLKSVVFYPAAKPSDTHASITPECNMMALTVENANVLAQTDITLNVGVSKTIAWKDIKLNGNVMIAPLPEEIISAGSDALVISLTDYQFISEDGVKHVIKPLDLSRQMREVGSVAAVKALQVGEMVALNVPGGVKVTLSNDAGYCFLEDATDGLCIITPDYSKVLQESVLLTGKLVGTYSGGGIFNIRPDLSDYTEIKVNTAVGKILNDVTEIQGGEYDYRLISFMAHDKLAITSDGENIFVGGTLPVITSFVEGFVIPEKIIDITGVLYADENLGQPYLIIRSANDVNQDIPYEPANIETIGDEGTTVATEYYSLSGVKLSRPAKGVGIKRVTYSNGKKTTQSFINLSNPD
ncbi:MAG: hypothetical protein HUK06_05330 [Bacteroidaceae bacterium]|nr:hypothetical protein [Bacteroidaceae bacterium]